jgi:hypothetical protein
MTSLWPDTDPVFPELESVFDNLPAISVLRVPPDIPPERVDAWIAAHRKPARLEIRAVYDDQ